MNAGRDPGEYVHDGLARAQSELEHFVALLPADDAGWRVATNCPPWDVQRLAAHVVRSAESFATSVERGLRGILEPALTPEQRIQREQEIAAQAPARIRDHLREAERHFEDVVGGLAPEQLDTLGMHAYGPRSITWFVQQRLSELAFHVWDLRVSLGLGRDFDAETASWLLPMLVESNLPAVYQRTREREGTPEDGWQPLRLGLRVAGAPELAWTLDGGPRTLTVTPGADGAGTVVEGSAAALALLVYGRVTLDELEREGNLRVLGDRELAARFWRTVGQP